MRYTLAILILFCSFQIFGQENDSFQEASDSLNKIAYLESLDTNAFSSLRICYSSMYVCEGIIDGSESHSIPNTDSIIIRVTISHERDSIFQIQYRRNEKTDFKNGSFKVFTLNGNSSLAVPHDNYEFNISTEEVNNPWNYMPASSDGREVMYSYFEKGKIIFYQYKE